MNFNFTFLYKKSLLRQTGMEFYVCEFYEKEVMGAVILIHLVMLHNIHQNGLTLMFAYFYKDNNVQMSNFINVINHQTIGYQL